MRIVVVALGLALGACVGGADQTSAEHAGAAQPDECEGPYTYEDCQVNGKPGARSCEVGEEGYVWGACLPTTGCKPGDGYACGGPYGGSATCAIVDGEWRYPPSSCSTPLVLAFGDEPVEFTRAAGAFDLAGSDTLVQTDWVRESTPWLVLDRNANGTIDDGAELFGSMTRLPDGRRATNGFSALAPLDADGDGWITAKDPAFARLALWRDLDQDRVSSADELRPAAESVIALSLRYTDAPRCLGGNCERERADFVYRDRQGNERRGSVVDVHLSHR
jgi:hypothetical protein